MKPIQPCFVLLILLTASLVADLTPEVKASPSWGITSDSNYWYVETANMKIYINKADGRFQFFVDGSNWTSTKGFGGFHIVKINVDYNDGAGEQQNHFPNPNPPTQNYLNTTHLRYTQKKAAGSTLEFYVEISVKAESIELLFWVKNLESVVRGYTVTFEEWLKSAGLKRIFPLEGFIEQPWANYFTAQLFIDEMWTDYPATILTNQAYSLATVQAPYYPNPMYNYGIFQSSNRETHYFGYANMRGMPNQNTSQVGVIFYAVKGNSFYALNKMPGILKTYVSFIELSKDFWHIFQTKIDMSKVTDTLLNELKARDILNIEVQFINSSYWTTNRNLTHTVPVIQSFLSNLKNKGFKVWFYMTISADSTFPSHNLTQVMNLYSDALTKDSNGANVTTDYGTLNCDPAYSWGAQIKSDMDYLITNFGSYITGFFIDLLVSSNRLDYNPNHNPILLNETSGKNATTLGVGMANLLTNLRAKGYPLVGNAPTQLHTAYKCDGVLLWDEPVYRSILEGKRYSWRNWLLPEGFLKSGISSNVTAIQSANNQLYYQLSYLQNAQPYVFGYTSYPTFYANKTTYHLQNAWFMQQKAEMIYGAMATIKLANANTRTIIFNGTTIGSITSDTYVDVFTKSGLKVATSTKQVNVNTYLTGNMDIFVIHQSQKEPYILLAQASKIESETYTSTTDTLSFTVLAPPSTTTTTKVYATRKPVGISGASTWAYNSASKVLTINAEHSSSVSIAIICLFQYHHYPKVR